MSQVIRFGPEDKGGMASFLRASIAAVRTLLGIPTDAVAYHVTVNYLAGTFYPSHLDAADRDAPGGSVSNLCLQGDALVLYTSLLAVSHLQQCLPSPKEGYCTKNQNSAYSPVNGR